MIIGKISWSKKVQKDINMIRNNKKGPTKFVKLKVEESKFSIDNVIVGNTFLIEYENHSETFRILALWGGGGGNFFFCLNKILFSIKKNIFTS